MRGLLGALVLSTLVNACSASGTVDAAVDDSRAANGRLAVVKDDGSLVTRLPDGTDEVLIESAPSSRPPTAVTWSPDGTRLAWSTIDDEGAVVAVADAAGDDRRRVQTSVPSFFLLWDRAGERLASLGTANGGVSLNVIDQEAGEILVTGSPLYVSWSPDGRELVAHRSDDLRIVDTEGRNEVAPVDDALFSTPIWLEDGRVVFAAADGADTVVMAGDLTRDDGVTQELLRVEGRVALAADDAGEHLAVSVYPSSPDAGLFVVDLTTTESLKIADEPGLWWSWSPAGDRLLVMTLAASGDRVGWSAWDGSDWTVLVETYRPTRDFILAYGPFADQWDLAVDFWSPDGTAFAFAGLSPAGQSTVFVQGLDGGLPEAVGSGYFVSWSPV